MYDELCPLALKVCACTSPIEAQAQPPRMSLDEAHQASRPFLCAQEEAKTEGDEGKEEGSSVLSLSAQFGSH